MLSVLALAFTACTKKQKKLPFADNLDLTMEEIFADDLMEDIMAESFAVIFDASEYGIFKSEEEEDGLDCRIKTVEHPDRG